MVHGQVNTLSSLKAEEVGSCVVKFNKVDRYGRPMNPCMRTYQNDTNDRITGTDLYYSADTLCGLSSDNLCGLKAAVPMPHFVNALIQFLTQYEFISIHTWQDLKQKLDLMTRDYSTFLPMKSASEITPFSDPPTTEFQTTPGTFVIPQHRQSQYKEYKAPPIVAKILDKSTTKAVWDVIQWHKAESTMGKIEHWASVDLSIVDTDEVIQRMKAYEVRFDALHNMVAVVVADEKDVDLAVFAFETHYNSSKIPTQLRSRLFEHGFTTEIAIENEELKKNHRATHISYKLNHLLRILKYTQRKKFLDTLDQALRGCWVTVTSHGIVIVQPIDNSKTFEDLYMDCVVYAFAVVDEYKGTRSKHFDANNPAVLLTPDIFRRINFEEAKHVQTIPITTLIAHVNIAAQPIFDSIHKAIAETPPST
jgi:hypothetical protein